MENFSEIIQSLEIPLEIHVYPYIFDHQFLGNAVFPAVEALQVLAESNIENSIDVEGYCIKNAQFLRFLTIEKEQKTIEALNEIQIDNDGVVHSTLVTVAKLRGGTITRKKEHVKVEFSKEKQEIKELLFEDVSQLSGDMITVNSKKIYKELVPFLESYHNIIDDVQLSIDGAVAKVKAPDFCVAEGCLGSPFPFDAAFHAACVWGQRFTGIVGFPMGFRERQIIKSTKAGEVYLSRIFPIIQNKEGNIFDIWIFDLQGILHEIIYGVIMSDVSADRMKPPQWIKEEF